MDTSAEVFGQGDGVLFGLQRLDLDEDIEAARRLRVISEIWLPELGSVPLCHMTSSSLASPQKKPM